jgi:hypothetical protein
MIFLSSLPPTNPYLEGVVWVGDQSEGERDDGG